MSFGTNELRAYGGRGFAATPIPQRRVLGPDPGMDGGFAIRTRADLMGFPTLLHPPSYRRHRELHISVIGAFSDAWARIKKAVVTGTYPHNPQELRSAHWFIPRCKLEDSSMISNRSETAIDEIVARCNGDVHGALKALLLVNEQLEAELQQLYAAVAVGGPFERGSNALH
jgi:hypothetical protein